MNAANTLSFTVHKYYDNGKLCKLWDNIIDFKLVWLKDFNEYYKISVSINEADETIKNVVGTALCESELSSLILYNLDVNSDNDIKYHDYERTTFYNPEKPSLSLLHRVLSKTPHYKIKYVSNSLSNEKRILSADGTTIYDFLVGDVSKEFDCLFKFDSFDRNISVYDLLNFCPKCNKRTDSDICPDCGNKSMIKGYGTDTNILINTNNIAQEITLDSNQDQVKNCLKIIAGDDIMSAAVKDISPNGSEYITYFSKTDYKNMPSGLVNKLKQYSLEVESKNSRYTQVLTDLYNAYDNLAYLTSTMMPDITHEVGTATEQIQKLTSSTLSPVAIKDVSTASIYTVNNAVLGMAKCLINTTDFKIDIVDNSSSLTSQTWTGKFIVSSYIKDDEGNPKDTATSQNISVAINDDVETFIEQKVKRCIQKEGSDDLSDLFKIESDEDFKSTLELYCLKRLESFLSAYDTCLQVLNEANCGVASSPFYESLYLPYYNRHNYIEDEYNERAKQIEAINTNINNLEWEKQSIQKGLNIKTYLGEDYLLYLTYLREDKYENSNYISDGLTNEEIIKHAKQLREKAEKELKKSAEMQYTVSGNLNNFLVLEDFKPMVNYFETGNYIRMEIDNVIYKMRLLSYELNFSEDNIQTLNVEFSDIINAKNNALGIKDVLAQAKSIASSFPSVITQVNKNTENALIAPGWVENGLSLTNLKIVSTADNQNMVVDNHGMWLKMYDDITCTYSPCQLKAQNNGIYLTKDNWKSIEVGVGEFVYIDPITKEEIREYGIIAKKIIGKQILGEDKFGIYNANNTMEFSDNGLFITTNDDDNKNSNAFTIQKQYTKSTGTVIERQLYIDEDGNITLAGAAKIKWENVNTPEIADIDGLDDYLEQLDGRIQTFSQENDPSDDWTTPALKTEHTGDIWLDTKNSLTRRWTGSEWETITDSELSELAKSKAQIFTITPKPPYYIGDLWVQGVNGDILTCKTTRTEGDFTSADWEIASKYTDDTKANSAYELAESANTLGGKLQKCLGFTTEIADDHIISPFIGGGYLQISSDNVGKVVIDPLGLTQQTHIFAIYNSNNNVVMGVDSSGNGYFQGKITATTGSIGGCELNHGHIFYNSPLQPDGKYYGFGLNGTMDNYDTEGAIAFYAGSSDALPSSVMNTAPLRIYHNGALYASKANITGNITATSGNIGGFVVIGNMLYSNFSLEGNGQGIGLISDSSANDGHGDILFYAGASNEHIDKATLRIYQNGDLFSSGKADFTNATVFANDFHATGSMYVEENVDIENILGVNGGINVGDGSDVYVSGSLNVEGDKNRIVKTEHYGTVALAAYETPTPYFGDVGSGITDINGICYIYFDEIFLETTIPNTEYYVFLQSYADSFVYVCEQTEYYFVVKSTKPNTKFVWEAKRRQKGTDNKRLEKFYN